MSFENWKKKKNWKMENGRKEKKGYFWTTSIYLIYMFDGSWNYQTM